MINDQRTIDTFYTMLIEKNSNYEGTFYVGVKPAFFADQLALPKNLKKKTVSFLKQQKKLHWLHTGLVKGVSH